MATNAALNLKLYNTVKDYSEVIREVAQKYEINLPIPDPNSHMSNSINGYLPAHVAQAEIIFVLSDIIQNQKREIDNLQESVENITRELRLFDHAPASKPAQAAPTVAVKKNK